MEGQRLGKNPQIFVPFYFIFIGNMGKLKIIIIRSSFLHNDIFRDFVLTI